MNELDQQRSEKDKKSQEYQDFIDKEREAFKAKLGELEKRYKDSEYSKNQQMFEIEKEKAKWNLEKD